MDLLDGSLQLTIPDCHSKLHQIPIQFQWKNSNSNKKLKFEKKFFIFLFFIITENTL